MLNWFLRKQPYSQPVTTKMMEKMAKFKISRITRMKTQIRIKPTYLARGPAGR
jgi:hypothetical protein